MIAEEIEAILIEARRDNARCDEIAEKIAENLSKFRLDMLAMLRFAQANTDPLRRVGNPANLSRTEFLNAAAVPTVLGAFLRQFPDEVE